MLCLDCGSPTRVLESRPADAGVAVRRRRECRSCGRRFTTFERVEVERLWVQKRDGRRQPFDAAKLRAALGRAAHKRDVSSRELDRIVDAAAGEAREGSGMIAADRIGELCLEALRRLDRGAYLQFAGTLPVPPAENAEFAGASPSPAEPVPSGVVGSMASPRKTLQKER